MDPATLPPLDQLLAPVALYPDPLVSLILPAATYPDQVQQAANFIQGGGSPSQIGNMNWDSSVQGLAHYPAVLEWMGANYDWTLQMGGAFANQPDAVMDAVQDLRRRALAAGTLVSNRRQRVINYENTVQIVPEQAQMIYVPQYDPSVVYVAQPAGFNSEPLFAWSQPYPAGVWLTFDFDWSNHGVYQGDWYDYHMQHGGWAQPVNYTQFRENGGTGNPGYRGWHAPRNAPPAPPQLSVGVSVGSVGVQARFAQPAVMRGTPRPPANAVRVNSLVAGRNEHPVTANPASPRGSPAQTGQRTTNEPAQAHPAAANSGGTNPHAGTGAVEPRIAVEPRTAAEPRTAVEPRTAAEPRTAVEPRSPAPAERPSEPAAVRNPGPAPSSAASHPEPVREGAPAKATNEVAKPKATPAPKEQAPKPKDKDEETPPK
jgi:hypothetical protein